LATSPWAHMLCGRARPFTPKGR